MNEKIKMKSLAHLNTEKPSIEDKRYIEMLRAIYFGKHYADFEGDRFSICPRDISVEELDRLYEDGWELISLADPDPFKGYDRMIFKKRREEEE